MTFRESLRIAFRENGVPEAIWKEAEKQAEEQFRRNGASLDDEMPVSGHFKVENAAPLVNLIPMRRVEVLLQVVYALAFVDGLQHGVNYPDLNAALSTMFTSSTFELLDGVQDAEAILDGLKDEWPGMKDGDFTVSKEKVDDAARLLLRISTERITGGHHGKN